MSKEENTAKEKRRLISIPLPSINNMVPILLIGSIVLAFFVGTLWQKVQALESGTTSRIVENNQPQQPSSAENVKPVSENDHVRGDRNARIALIEYSDLECPFCKSFHPTVQQVIDEYDGQVMWVYRHFPLDQIHAKADKEAEAVECANELAGNDGFWALLDKIFEVTPSNNGLVLDNLPKLAGEVGIDEGAFKECLDSGKYAQRVEDDYQGGIEAGITGTPGNILLDTKTGETLLVPGALPFEQIKQSIDSLLAS
jgi:protein-disulfide isomerase